jgi:hypothetical protein
MTIMKINHILVLIAAFICGAVLYCALLWDPLSEWLFEHILLPMSLQAVGQGNGNLNFPEGIGLSLLLLIFLVLLFILPYILLWVIVAFLVFRSKTKKNNP